MENKHIQILKSIWINCCRYILSALFIFSGFVKIIDPLGSFYKLEDYAIAFGLIKWTPDFLLLLAGIGLAGIEFIIGLFLFFGIRRNISTGIGLLLMLFMTPLTLILALTNPISDCGCFGDALVLSNWETFWKNVVLLAIAIYLFRNRRGIISFFTEKTNWIVSLYSILFVASLAIYNYRYLPILDFRPYTIGTNISEGMSIPDDAEEPVYETLFLMEKQEEQKWFDLENYPDSTWTFVDSETNLIKPGFVPKIENFSIIHPETGENITSEVLEDTSYTFLLIAYQIDKANDSNIDLINEVYDYSVDNGYKFICLTSSLLDQVEEWSDKTGAEYPFYLTDEITLKTMIRSNPGLILIKEGRILNKWSHRSIPDEYQLIAPLDQLELGKVNTTSTKESLLSVLLWYFVPLALLFLLDLLNRRRKQNK